MGRVLTWRGVQVQDEKEDPHAHLGVMVGVGCRVRPSRRQEARMADELQSGSEAGTNDQQAAGRVPGTRQGWLAAACPRGQAEQGGAGATRQWLRLCPS